MRITVTFEMVDPARTWDHISREDPKMFVSHMRDALAGRGERHDMLFREFGVRLKETTFSHDSPPTSDKE